MDIKRRALLLFPFTTLLLGAKKLINDSQLNERPIFVKLVDKDGSSPWFEEGTIGEILEFDKSIGLFADRLVTIIKTNATETSGIYAILVVNPPQRVETILTRFPRSVMGVVVKQQAPMILCQMNFVKKNSEGELEKLQEGAKAYLERVFLPSNS